MTKKPTYTKEQQARCKLYKKLEDDVEAEYDRLNKQMQKTTTKFKIIIRNQSLPRT